MNIAAIIVGIDGYEKYTKPLIESIRQHEPECHIVVVDNASSTAYPDPTEALDFVWARVQERLCYSAAINHGKDVADNGFGKGPFDWYIVLSNDVLCTGPFAHMLQEHGDMALRTHRSIVGPLMKDVHGFPYLEGWCVCVPSAAWEAVGGWDEKFIGSSWEDVSFSTDARLKGFGLVEDKNLPFVHLDQRQRFHVIPDYWSTENANIQYFREKYSGLLVGQGT